MKGHIRERSPGHWAIILDVRGSADRRAQTPLAGLRGTKRQAPIGARRGATFAIPAAAGECFGVNLGDGVTHMHRVLRKAL